MDAENIAGIAKALAHPARVQILELLAVQDECRGADVFAELPLAQSTVSQHLAVLRDAGLVSSSREGVSAVYCLRHSVLDSFASAVSGLAGMTSGCAKGACR